MTLSRANRSTDEIRLPRLNDVVLEYFKISNRKISLHSYSSRDTKNELVPFLLFTGLVPILIPFCNRQGERQKIFHWICHDDVI